MQPRLSPKHKHQIISHSELRVGRPGKQSDWRMYWSSREGGAPSQESWSILWANYLNLWQSLCTSVQRNVPSARLRVWWNAWATLTLPTPQRMTCQKETNVCVTKRLPGVWGREGGGGSAGAQHRKPLSPSWKPPLNGGVSSSNWHGVGV